MFPRDPVANASQILADLAGVFPVNDGTFVIAAMVKMHLFTRGGIVGFFERIFRRGRHG